MIKELSIPRDYLFAYAYNGEKTKDEWKALVLKAYKKAVDKNYIFFRRDSMLGLQAMFDELGNRKYEKDIGFYKNKKEWIIFRDEVALRG